MATVDGVTRQQGLTRPIRMTVNDTAATGAVTGVRDMTGATKLVLGINPEAKWTASGDQATHLLTGTVITPETDGIVEFTPDSAVTALGIGTYHAQVYFEQAGDPVYTQTFDYCVTGRIVAGELVT